MKRAYDFITELDLGLMGFREVDVSYSYDPKTSVKSLMAVYLMDGKNLGPEITDYLNGHGEDQLYEEMESDLPKQLAEEAEYAAECAADAAREERLIGGAA